VAAQDNEQNAQLDNMMIKMSPRDRQSEGLLARAYDSRVENATNRIRLPQERPNWEPSMIAHNDELSCATNANSLARRRSNPDSLALPTLSRAASARMICYPARGIDFDFSQIIVHV